MCDVRNHVRDFVRNNVALGIELGRELGRKLADPKGEGNHIRLCREIRRHKQCRTLADIGAARRRSNESRRRRRIEWKGASESNDGRTLARP